MTGSRTTSVVAIVVVGLIAAFTVKIIGEHNARLIAALVSHTPKDYGILTAKKANRDDSGRSPAAQARYDQEKAIREADRLADEQVAAMYGGQVPAHPAGLG